MGTIIGAIYDKYEEYEDLCEEKGWTCLPIQEKGWLKILQKHQEKVEKDRKETL